MSVAPQKRALTLRIVMIITAILGMLAFDWLPNSAFRALVVIAVSAILAFLWKSVNAGRPFAERRRLLAVTPKVSEIGKGLLVMLLAFPWVVLCGLAVRYRVLVDSAATLLIILAPAGAFFLCGIFVIGRAYYHAFHDS